MDMRIDPKKERQRNNGQGYHAVLRAAERQDEGAEFTRLHSKYRNPVASQPASLPTPRRMRRI